MRTREVRIRVVEVRDLEGHKWAVIGEAHVVWALLTPDMDVLDLLDLNDVLRRWGVSRVADDVAAAFEVG